jgi:hypothetical protein
MPDQQLAASYHRLADSYQRLARFNDQLTAFSSTMEMTAPTHSSVGNAAAQRC